MIKKRQFIEEFCKRRFTDSKKIKSFPSLFTIKPEDISKCSPQQVTELIRYLLLSECSAYRIPQNSIHIADNISAPDGG